MSILQWITSVPVSASEQISNLLQNPQNANSELFIAYLILSLLIKRSSFLMAFFISCMLFEASLFDSLSEASLYLITFSVYSYVIFSCKTIKSISACGILLILSIILAYDAYFYGENGHYGASETIIYNNIEYLATCAHCFLIGSLVPITRIRNNLQSFIDSISRIALNSDYMLIYWYNVSKAINK